MQLYKHQEFFLKENPNHALLAFDTGTGKTLTALLWAEKRPNYNHLIVVPKNIKGKWIRDVEEHGKITATIVTKEEFKTISKKNLQIHSSIIIDESDFFGSTLFTKGRSQLAEHLYNFIKEVNPDVLLMTATPFRNAPHTIHTLLTYIHQAPKWAVWQNMCYKLMQLPYLPHPAWLPTKNWRKEALEYAIPRMYVAKIEDIADVPTQYEEKYEIETTPLLNPISDTQVGIWHEEARAENGKEKLDWIKDYIRGKSKVIIVCRYKKQIADYAKELEKIREVFILTGEVNNQDEVIENAKQSFECVFLIQASMGAGFELPEFSYVIFASLSFSHRDYVQMKGRVLRINRLKSNWYTYLIGGVKDKAVYDRIMLAEDFTI